MNNNVICQAKMQAVFCKITAIIGVIIFVIVWILGTGRSLEWDNEREKFFSFSTIAIMIIMVFELVMSGNLTPLSL